MNKVEKNIGNKGGYMKYKISKIQKWLTKLSIQSNPGSDGNFSIDTQSAKKLKEGGQIYGVN